jgi:hypothetical protein
MEIYTEDFSGAFFRLNESVNSEEAESMVRYKSE